MSVNTKKSYDYGVRPAGYRLPEETRLGRVTLAVSDLARSAAWYARVLGLTPVSRDALHAVLGDLSGNPLVELREETGARPAPRHGRLGLYHFAVLVPDRASLGRFVAHLAATGTRAGMSDHLVSEAIYLNDPDGLGIEVYADRPRDTWSSHGSELVMATNPLDVEDLLRAAGNEVWQGMPAGTQVGHVHLHVGDLQGASDFYHQALGMDAVVRGYPGALFLSAGGYHHHLGTNTWAGNAPSAVAGEARLLEWEVVLPDETDVASASESLRAAGHVVDRGVVRDPWGTALRIVAGNAK